MKRQLRWPKKNPPLSLLTVGIYESEVQIRRGGEMKVLNATTVRLRGLLVLGPLMNTGSFLINKKWEASHGPKMKRV